jgi:Ca2+-binding EF-hand superfamily protein
MFRILDVNQDGHVSKDEARKSAETTASWKSLDSDLNDRLSFEEFCAQSR